MINNKSFWRMYLPLYRADYSMIGRYRFDEVDLTAGNIPAAVFYSETDTALSEMIRWKQVFSGKCSFFEFTGTHFFINEHHKEIAEIISRMMSADGEVQL